MSVYLPIGLIHSLYMHPQTMSVSLQVEFSYPAHVSEGSRDLINRLLKHNPMHRLPIQGVMAHPWVVENSTKKPTTRTAADNWGTVWSFHSSNGKFLEQNGPFRWSFLPLFGKLYNLYVAFVLCFFTCYNSDCICKYLITTQIVKLAITWNNKYFLLL